MRFSRNFFISQPIKLKFGAGTQNRMPILILGAKSGFGDDFGQYDTKTIILRRFFGQTPLRNGVATPKIPGDQKLFERVCYELKLKITKFQLPRPNGFWALLKKQLGGKFLSRLNGEMLWPLGSFCRIAFPGHQVQLWKGFYIEMVPWPNRQISYFYISLGAYFWNTGWYTSLKIIWQTFRRVKYRKTSKISTDISKQGTLYLLIKSQNLKISL